MKQRVLKVHPDDNVIVALQDIAKGETVKYNGKSYKIVDDIPAKHKFFENDMNAGDEVTCMVYWLVKRKILFQGWLNDNCKHQTCSRSYDYRGSNYTMAAPDVSKFKDRTFNGYHRSDGRVGTANYWLFIPTVFCENRNLDVIREALHNELGYAVTDKYKQYTHQLLEAYKKGEDISDVDLSLIQSIDNSNASFKNVDGIKFLNHQGGCGGTRQDAAILSKLLAAYADHPNVAGVTVLSLGCQNLQVQGFSK